LALFLLSSSVNGIHFDDNHKGHSHHAGCGTPDPNPQEMKILETRVERYNIRYQQRSSNKLCNGCVKIDVIFHVIEDSLQESQTSHFATDDNINHFAFLT
jgi:hypothetical protein